MSIKNKNSLITLVKTYSQKFLSKQFIRSTRTQLFLVVFFVNLLFIPVGIASPNEGSRYLLTKTIVENDSFAWPASWFNNQSGYWFFPDFGVDNGFISDKAPGMSLVLVPCYLLGKGLYQLIYGVNTNNAVYSSFDDFMIYFLKICIIFFASLLAVKLFDLLELINQNKKHNLSIVLVCSLGSLFFLYTPTLFPAVISALLYVYIIYFLLLFVKEKSPVPLLQAGILAGFSIVVEYGSLLMIPWFIWFILIYSLESGLSTILKRILIFVTFVLIGFSPLFVYNYVLSGDPFVTSYFFSHWISFIHFYHNIFDGLLLLLVDPNKGLFILNPILFFACIGFFVPSYFKKHYRELIIIVFPCLMFIVFYAKNFDPSGGTAVGPRYIIALIPLLSIGLQGWLSIRSIRANDLTILSGLITIYKSVFLSLGIGILPISNTDNPVQSEAIPLFLSGHFNPILAKIEPLLFFLFISLIFLTIYLVYKDQIRILVQKLVNQIRLTMKEIDIETENVVKTDQKVVFNTKSNIIITLTLWSFFLYTAVFLLIGTQVLSKQYYLKSNPNELTDLLFIIVLLLVALSATLKSYLSFKQIPLSRK